jgi:hypothetical protein
LQLKKCQLPLKQRTRNGRSLQEGSAIVGRGHETGRHDIGHLQVANAQQATVIVKDGPGTAHTDGTAFNLHRHGTQKAFGGILLHYKVAGKIL